MAHNEFKRWLVKQGARFEEGKSHTKVYLNDRMSVLPRHGRREIPAGTLSAVKKQLGIK